MNRQSPAGFAPDRAAYEAETGLAPWVVPSNLPDIASLEKRAKLLSDNDWSTLDETKAESAKANLDECCQRVEMICDANGLIWFDPNDGHFWVYPEKEPRSVNPPKPT